MCEMGDEEDNMKYEVYGDRVRYICLAINIPNYVRKSKSLTLGAYSFPVLALPESPLGSIIPWQFCLIIYSQSILHGLTILSPCFLKLAFTSARRRHHLSQILTSLQPYAGTSLRSFTGPWSE